MPGNAHNSKGIPFAEDVAANWGLGDQYCKNGIAILVETEGNGPGTRNIAIAAGQGASTFLPYGVISGIREDFVRDFQASMLVDSRRFSSPPECSAHPRRAVCAIQCLTWAWEGRQALLTARCLAADIGALRSHLPSHQEYRILHEPRVLWRAAQRCRAGRLGSRDDVWSGEAIGPCTSTLSMPPLFPGIKSCDLSLDCGML